MESVLVALPTFFRRHGIKGLVPSPYTSACKRSCMFLRWMVRDGSPVLFDAVNDLHDVVGNLLVLQMVVGEQLVYVIAVVEHLAHTEVEHAHG